MVYPGHRSTGCGTCRARKIKCDEARPICDQCTKSGRDCRGYRTGIEVRYRHQTQETKERVTRDRARRYERDTNDLASAGVSSVEKPLRQPAMSLEYQAECCFASSFILEPGPRNQVGFFDYLRPLLQKEPANSPVRQALTACGLAVLGANRTSRYQDLPKAALIAHSTAIVKTHMALKGPAARAADSILATVLLLSLFENIMALPGTGGLLVWRSHIEGAVNIVVTRHRELLATHTGRLLFNSLRIQLIARVWSSGIPLPLDTAWWMQEHVVNDASAECQRFSLKTSELRSQLTKLLGGITRDSESRDRVADMLRQLEDTERAMTTWMESLSEQHTTEVSLAYKKPHMSDDELVTAQVFLNGRVDTYSDVMIASTWNTARVSRLVLASLIIRCVAWLGPPADYHMSPVYRKSVTTCEDIVADMIASIPYFLGFKAPKEPGQPSSPPENPSFACGEDGSSKPLPALLIAWPMATIISLDFTTERQRTWVKSRLNYIGKERGIRYAFVLASSNIRFPSMMIKRDGTMVTPDPLVRRLNTVLPTTPQDSNESRSKAE